MGFLWRRVVGLLVFLTVLGLGYTAVYYWDVSEGGTILAGRNSVIVPVILLFAALFASWLARAVMRSRARAMRRELRRRYR